VTLDSGASFTSDSFMETLEAAYESAAKNAVLSLTAAKRVNKVDPLCHLCATSVHICNVFLTNIHIKL
jgi:hypothetical protein